VAITLKGTLTGNITDPLTDGVVPIDSLSPAAGDLYIVTMQSGTLTFDTNFTNTVAGDVTSGFTKQVDLYANDTNDINLAVWTAISQGNDSYINLGTSSGNYSNNYSYLIRIYSGVDTTTPLDVAATTASGTNGDSANPASITPVTSGARVVAIYAAAQNTAALWGTTPANLNNFSQDNDSIARTIIGIGDAVVSPAGAFDPAAASGGDGNVRDSWTAVTLALRPLITTISLIVGGAISASQTTSPTLSPKTALTAASSVSSTQIGAITLGYSAPSAALAVNDAISPIFNNGQVYGGPDLLGGAGSFTSATGWNIVPGSGISITGGQFTSDGSNSSLRQTTYNTGKTGLIGKSYRILADFNVTAGTVSFYYAGAQTPTQTAPASGSISYAANAAGAVDTASVVIGTNSAVTADNFQVYDNTYNVLLGFKISVSTQSAASATQAGAVTLSPKTAIITAGAISASQAGNVTVGVGLLSASANSASLASQTVLTPKTALSLQNALSAGAVSNIILLPKTALVLAGAVSLSNVSSPTLSATGLPTNSAVSVSTTSSPVFASRYALSPASANSLSITPTVNILLKYQLAVANMSSMAALNAVALASKYQLVTSAATSASIATNLGALTVRYGLSANNARSISFADSVDIFLSLFAEGRYKPAVDLRWLAECTPPVFIRVPQPHTSKIADTTPSVYSGDIPV
jgi:hypothetical protein